jgi:hypothetical protein
MARDLKDELPVPPLIKELILGKSTDWEAAKHERSRTEAERLIGFFTTLPNVLNPLCLLELLSRNDQIGKLVPKNTADTFQLLCRTV